MKELLRVIGVVLEDEQGRIAMQLRDDRLEIANPNKWSIFGGKIEAGEEPEQAALREMKEEISVDLDPSKLVIVGRVHPRKRPVLRFLLRCDRRTWMRPS